MLSCTLRCGWVGSKPRQRVSGAGRSVQSSARSRIFVICFVNDVSLFIMLLCISALSPSSNRFRESTRQRPSPVVSPVFRTMSIFLIKTRSPVRPHKTSSSASCSGLQRFGVEPSFCLLVLFLLRNSTEWRVCTRIIRPNIRRCVGRKNGIARHFIGRASRDFCSGSKVPVTDPRSYKPKGKHSCIY